MQGSLRFILCIGLLAAAARADVVERRGSEPSLDGEVRKIDDAGVTIRSESGAEHFIAWDRIRSVKTNDPKRRQEAAERAAVAEDLWRARSRIERGDMALAEPLMERLFQRYRGQTHETALVVAQGLLRCRLARGEHALAVVPALETARLRRAGAATASYSMLSPVLDETTSLCATLPPAWAPSPLLTRLERDLAQYDAKGDEVVAALAMLYRRAVVEAMPKQAQNDPAKSGAADPQAGEAREARPLPRHPGVELLAAMVDCRSGTAQSRHAAAERLSRQAPSLPAWTEPWTRFHIGLAMLDEDDLEQHQLGLVNLLHVPARFSRVQPYLAGLALMQAAAALDRDGDADAAASLRAELQRSFPDHPAMRDLAARSQIVASSASAPRSDSAVNNKEHP